MDALLEMKHNLNIWNTPVFELNVIRGVSRKSVCYFTNDSMRRLWARKTTTWRA